MTEQHRLGKILPAAMAPSQRQLWDLIAGGPRAGGPFRIVDDEGGLEGPFNAMLLNPALGQALQGVGAAIRFEGSLDDRLREIAILVVAAAWDSGYERYAHEAVAATIGLGSTLLRNLRDLDVHAIPGTDGLVAQIALALAGSQHTQGGLSQPEYDQAVAVLGEARLFELTVLVGYYASLALLLRTFGDVVPDAAAGGVND